MDRGWPAVHPSPASSTSPSGNVQLADGCCFDGDRWEAPEAPKALDLNALEHGYGHLGLATGAEILGMYTFIVLYYTYLEYFSK